MHPIWLEELASESNTIQAQEDITQPGKTAGPDARKLYITFGRFFIDISGLINSFGLALCVALEYDVLLQPEAAGSSRSPWEKDSGIQGVANMMDFA